MALIGTSGVIRSGKTALNTALALIEAEKDDTEVYANYKINHPKIKYLNNVDEFMELKFDEMNGTAIVQEFQVWAESRLSGKEITRMVDKTVLQSGKLGFDIVWDAQLNSSVDKRIRLNTTNWFATRRKWNNPRFTKAFTFRYVYLDERLRLHKFRMPPKETQWPVLKKIILDKYDTKQLAELKRKFEKAKLEGDKTNSEYEKTETEKLIQPNGEMIDKVTPYIKDTPAPLFDKLLSEGMEIVQDEFSQKKQTPQEEPKQEVEILAQ